MSLLEKEWFIQAPWGRISIIAWGECSDPPVLLCHGQLDSAASFRPLVRLLPTNFYYIGLELPGNGKSDRFPAGLMVNVYDLVYVLKLVADHFRWDSFVYMAHSLGTLIGKLYDVSYPDKLSAVVELDPAMNISATVEAHEFANWYHHFFSQYYAKYSKYNGDRSTAPRYSRRQARGMLVRARGVGEEVAELLLERNVASNDDGSVSFTFDQRIKLITLPPFSSTFAEQLFTKSSSPRLVLCADSSVRSGLYNHTGYNIDEGAYPNRNCRVREVSGAHDVHITHPERVAHYVAKFLQCGLDGLDDRKAKL